MVTFGDCRKKNLSGWTRKTNNFGKITCERCSRGVGGMVDAGGNAAARHSGTV